MDTEADILEYWDRIRAFERSLELTKGQKRYVFFDGPPFATGLPHYGHLLGGMIKDVIPRYKTMTGHYVERVWGWDTHGLPIEFEIEKKLGIKTKQQVLEYVFNFVSPGIEFLKSKYETATFPLLSTVISGINA